ncbi:MAG: hypothetical protein EPN82_02575 [Bacteroidetes bacterium]|nr:MAG: hypothetical protein EPN82_02575 [Bacteroidota bacterium]
MERLNYFNPYNSKEPYYEDQLTRTFLVLMKYSFHVVSIFYNYCFKQLNNSKSYTEISLPYLDDLINEEWKFETQKINPEINSELLLSVLITDENIENEKINIARINRDARYDGIITIGNEITIIIEVKPQSQNVRDAQLSPSGKNLSDETLIIGIPVILQWKEIIRKLNNLLVLPVLSSQEKLMINDFLFYINDNYPQYNPFINFGLCQNIENILYNRIKNLLKSIVTDEDFIEYHRGWGYIINLSEKFNEISQIGLILNYNNDNSSWYIELIFCFGCTIRQSRFLYDKTLTLDIPKREGWLIEPNPHVSFRSQNLVFFKSKIEVDAYLDYWKNNKEEIRMYKRNEIDTFLTKLNENNIINYDNNAMEKMQEKFYNTKIPSLNFSPEIAFKFKINSEKAIVLDKDLSLANLIKYKIVECISFIGAKEEDLADIIKI